MSPLRQLAATPHRIMFATGMFALVASALWWTVQIGARLAASTPATVLPAGWLHALLFLYGPFPPFVFGFLMTTFARWQDAPEAPRPAFVASALAFAAAEVVIFPAMHLSARGIALALGLVALGAALGGAVLFGMWRRAQRRVAHATACLGAVAMCIVGAAAAAGWAAGGAPALLELAIGAALWGFLLPAYFAVGHRMVPFFSSVAIADYEIFRPAWSLPAALALSAGHLALTLAHLPQWAWTVDAPLAALAFLHTAGWQPWKARGVRLLLSLHLGFAWFGVALALYAAQSFGLWWDGVPRLGRMPLHALALGMFGSLLVAMVTRVTMGHSGRPLVMDGVAWTCFLGVQLAAVTRLVAELGAGRAHLVLLAVAASAWLATLAVWAVRCLPIYLAPRADGKPG